MEEPKNLKRYVDVQQVQQLQDSFAHIAGVYAVILDLAGEPLTKPSSPAACAVESTEAFWAEKACVLLRKKAAEKRAPAWGPAGAGAVALAVPLMMDEEHLGWWAAWWMPDGQPTMAQAEHMAGMLVALDEMMGRLALRTERLQQVIHNYEDANRQLQAFMDASETAMYVSDYHTGEMLMVNRAFCRQEGVDADMVLGEKCWKAIHNSKKGFCNFCPRGSLLEQGGKPSGVHVWEHYNQRTNRWMRCANKAIHWTGGRMAHMVTLVDITNERQLHDNLTRIAYYDRHTGLANTEKLYIDLREMQTDPDIDNIHLVCLQLKSMNQFNRLYGKKNGYGLHAAMGEWLQGLGEKFSVYSTGGYGFILLLPNRSLRQCKAAVREIRARFEEAWQLDIDGNTVFHYCSVAGSIICMGSALFHRDIDDLVERTLQSAVDASEFPVYDESVDRQEKQRVEFEIALKNQVRNGMEGFDVHYQPIVDAKSGIWRGMEALCRWTNRATGKSVTPALFIPEAERLGLIGEIGQWVLVQSVALCKKLQLDKIEDFFLSVNMSFGQVMDEGFVERVAEVLDTYDYPPEKLNLEVTESMEFNFDSFALSAIESFKKLGVGLALDDFGTGYSSFYQLKNLPAKFIKTERKFVLDIENDRQMQHFYYVISELAHMNGMRLIAEGVENQEQLEVVRKNGADLIQGFYFSRPLPKEQLADCLARFGNTAAAS